MTKTLSFRYFEPKKIPIIPMILSTPFCVDHSLFLVSNCHDVRCPRSRLKLPMALSYKSCGVIVTVSAAA